MSTFLLRRLIQMAFLLLLISMLVFGILQLVPGGPFDQLLADPQVSPADVERLNKLIGLDKPLPQRYGEWLIRAVRLDWGDSWRVAFGQPVGKVINDRLPQTIQLMSVSILLSMLIALPIGIYSAIRQYSKIDYLVTGLSFVGISMPVFWFALMLMIVFAVQLRWLPTSGISTPGLEKDWLDKLKHMIMPVLVLSLTFIAQWSRFMRASMLEILSLDYLRTARAKGLTERVVISRHGLRNALIPVITILGLDVPILFSGAIITETIFSWPGMGRLLFDAVFGNDWPVVTAVIMLTAFLVLVGNLLADLLYAVVDPRIRYT
ncbi:MAG TPA: ABC transporter permease [Chloroflexota bacterium]|nr:ABC transporter permease [Chloroflexota bacterium]